MQRTVTALTTTSSVVTTKLAFSPTKCAMEPLTALPMETMMLLEEKRMKKIVQLEGLEMVLTQGAVMGWN